MAVLINWKICDNSKDCSGIGVCPTHTITWDDSKKTLVIDNSKCNGCGACEKACPVGAIRVAKTDDDYKRIKKEIDEDPRKVSDLFVDRYGAAPISPAFEINESNFGDQIIEASQLAVVEFYSDASIQCLLKSVPVKSLFRDRRVKYRKMEADAALLKKYDIKTLPCLAFFRGGKLIGKVEGYYDWDRKYVLDEKIAKIIS